MLHPLRVLPPTRCELGLTNFDLLWITRSKTDAHLFCGSPQLQTTIYLGIQVQILSCNLCRDKEQINEGSTPRLEQECTARIRYQVIREGTHDNI